MKGVTESRSSSQMAYSNSMQKLGMRAASVLLSCTWSRFISSKGCKSVVALSKAGRSKKSLTSMSDADPSLVHGPFFRECDNHDELLNGPTFLSTEKFSNCSYVINALCHKLYGIIFLFSDFTFSFHLIVWFILMAIMYSGKIHLILHYLYWMPLIKVLIKKAWENILKVINEA